MIIETFPADRHPGLLQRLTELKRSETVYNGGVFILFTIPYRYYEDYASITVNRAVNDINAMDKTGVLQNLKIAYIECNVGYWHEWDTTKKEPKSIFKTDETLGLRQLPTLLEYSLAQGRHVEGRRVDLDEQFLSVEYIINFLLKRQLNLF
ncbi:hypothetical protein niasHT_004862 [Heterodera trifolii]|uniref:Uncharacterized protein n=1 Tax=Heterodera trifolii TaxID=157864 RepID=A0ABD2LUW2_9BILA